MGNNPRYQPFLEGLRKADDLLTEIGKDAKRSSYDPLNFVMPISKEGPGSVELMRRSVPFQVRQVGDEEERTLRFIGSDETPDSHNSLIRVDGWVTSTRFKDNPLFLWSHDPESLPVGQAVRVAKEKLEDGRKVLSFDIKFATKEENPFAEYVYRLYKGGFLRAVSVGFMPINTKTITDEKELEKMGLKPPAGTVYEKQELWELSAVTLPSNPKALIQEMRSWGEMCVRAIGHVQEQDLDHAVLKSILEDIRQELCGASLALGKRDVKEGGPEREGTPGQAPAESEPPAPPAETAEEANEGEPTRAAGILRGDVQIDVKTGAKGVMDILMDSLPDPVEAQEVVEAEPVTDEITIKAPADEQVADEADEAAEADEAPTDEAKGDEEAPKKKGEHQAWLDALDQAQLILEEIKESIKADMDPDDEEEDDEEEMSAEGGEGKAPEATDKANKGGFLIDGKVAAAFWHVLALKKDGINVRVENPDAITRAELLSALDSYAKRFFDCLRGLAKRRDLVTLQGQIQELQDKVMKLESSRTEEGTKVPSKSAHRKDDSYMDLALGNLGDELREAEKVLSQRRKGD